MRLSPELFEVDLYAVLGISETASPDQIRRAHRRRAIQSHPDLARGDRQQAEREMARVNVAASVLLDPALRATYDARRARNPWRAPRPRDESVDWVRPPSATRTRLTRELRRLLELAHPWPARPLAELDARLRRWPLERHVTVFALAAVMALFLIACSRPASLNFWCGDDCPRQPISGAHL